MGAVAVDSGGQVWWIDAGGSLHRRGSGILRDGVQAIAMTSSGVAVLGRDGRIARRDEVGAGEHALAGQADAAVDLAVDVVANVVYLAVAGAVIARALAGGDERTVAAIDATALILSPDRRRLYVADRATGAVLAVSLIADRTGAPDVQVVAPAAPAGFGAAVTGLGITGAGLVASWPHAVVGINVRHGVSAVIHGPEAALPLRAARGVAAGRNRRTLWIADEAGLLAVAADGTGIVADPAG